MNQKFWCWITTFALILGLCTPLGGDRPDGSGGRIPRRRGIRPRG